MSDIDWKTVVQEAYVNAHMNSDAALIKVGLWPDDVDEVTAHAINGGIKFGIFGVLSVLNQMGILDVPLEQDQFDDEPPNGYN